MKKVLYISYDGMTDPLGQSQVLPYLKGLTEKGHRITLLSFEKPNRYIQLKSVIEQQTSDIGIDWQPLGYTSKPPVLSSMIDFRRMQKTAISLHQEKKFDIVHCRGYLPAMAGRTLKMQSGVKFLFDMRGFWADERVEGGIWNKKNPLFAAIYTYFKGKEKLLLSEADAVISLTHAGKKIIRKWPFMLQKEDNITVIPCCTDFDHFSWRNIKVEKKSHFKKALNIQNDDFILTYLGSIGSWYMLPEMLEFFKVLLEFKPHAKLLFITREDDIEIKSRAAELNIPEEKNLCKGVPRENVPSLLSLSDLSVFFIKPVFSKQASSPTKLAEIMAMGIPVITNKGVGDVDTLFEKHFPEFLVKEFSEDDYRRVLSAYFKNKTLHAEDLNTIAREYFSLTDGIEKYHATYLSL